MYTVVMDYFLIVQVRSFGNGFTRNIIIFAVDNSLSCDTNNLKNNFLVFGEGSIDNIDGNVGAVEKTFSNNSNKNF